MSIAAKATGAPFVFANEALSKSRFTPTVGMNGANINCPSLAKEAKHILPWVGATAAPLSRYLLGVVFLMAAVSKIINLHDFENRVLLHSPLPQALAKVMPSGAIPLNFSIIRIVVAVLPWLELTCGLFLLFGRAVREFALIVD